MNHVNNSLSVLVAVVALGLAIACGGTTVGRTTDPKKLGVLAATIETVSPAEADRLFAQAGHDEVSFRAAVEEIMEDPDRVVVFSETYIKTKG